MAFQITEIFDSQSGNVLAKVLHQDNHLTATVRGMDEKNLSIGTPFQAGISFDEIRDWKVVDDFEDARSGIWQEEDGIHLLGRIHSIIDFGDGRVVIDVYLQNGPEFFTVNLNATDEDAPGANDGLEVIVGHLVLQPVS